MGIIQIDQMIRDESSCARLPHDEKYETGIAFVNGKICAAEEAMVPFWDHGFIHADATYEVVTVVRGRIFRLQDHFERLARSCEKFRLRNPYSNDEMAEIFSEMLRLSGFKNAGIFWCVTRGLAKPGRDASRERLHPDAFENRFYANVYPMASIVTQAQRNRGLDIMVTENYIRIPEKALDPTAKNFHWLDMKLSLFEASDLGKDWSVLTDAEGYLTEAPGANIFLIKNGELYTPDSGCLHGITRKSVLELAEMTGIPTHVERVHARQLREAEDAFLATTTGGIAPINSVDGIVLGGIEGPGPLATRFHNLFWEKKWEGWKSFAVDYREKIIDKR
jgi:branched-chain amino acid aminotransferase